MPNGFTLLMLAHQGAGPAETLEYVQERQASWRIGRQADDCPAADPLLPTGYTGARPFTRVTVDYRVLGLARIAWELSPRFREEEPYSFQLQVAHAAVDGADWLDVGNPAVGAPYLSDAGVQRIFGKARDLAYRVKLLTAASTFFSRPAETFGHLSTRDWNLVRDIYRKEQLLHRRYTSSQGFLFKAKRHGTPCPRCLSEFTGETTDSRCPVCYGTGFQCGYWAGVPSVFVNVGLASNREAIDGQGNLATTRSDVMKGRMVGFPMLASRDLWVDADSDERFFVHEVEIAAQHRSVPVVYAVELRQAPTTDIIHTLPLPPVLDPDDPDEAPGNTRTP